MKVKLKLKPFIMKIKNIIWLTFLCLVTYQSFSQVKKNSAGFVYPPKDFNGIITDEIVKKYSSSTINWNKIKFNNKGTWKVYSVRKNNIIGRDGSPIDVDFNQEMDVKGFEDSHLQVEWDDINGERRDGVIDHKDVFMWRNSLCSNNGFPRKVLVLSKFSSGQAVNNAAWSFYDHPDCRPHNQIPHSSANNLEIFFILKETDDSYLLSSSSKDGSLMRGWMKSDNVTPWNTRVAYDESVGLEAGKIYGNNEIPIFHKETNLQGFLDNPDNLAAFKPIYKGECQARFDPTVKFPFDRPLLLNLTEFNKKSVDLRELIIVVNKKKGEHIKDAEIRREFKKLERRSRNVNILFVIDATRSMQSNITAVKNSILSFNNSLVDRNRTDINFKVALTIYRDAEDGLGMFNNKLTLKPIDEKKDGELIWEKIISGVVCKSNSKDYTHEEQVYRGLYEGISGCGFKDHETNIVILIGDAGNDDAKSSKTRAEIDKLLTEKNLNIDLFVFQSSNRMSPAFESFSDDAMHWMSLIDGNPKNNLRYRQDDGLTIVNVVPDDDALYASRGTFITQVEKSGDIVNPVVLIDKLTTYLEESYNKAKTKERKLREGRGKSLSEDAIQIIADNLGITYEMADARLKHNVELSTQGYSNMVYYDQLNEENPVHCYQPYIFLTSGELEEVENMFLDLGASPATGADASKNLGSFIQQEILQFNGLNRNDIDETSLQYQRIMDKTVQQAWMEIFNVDFVYPQIAKTKILKLSSQSGEKFGKELNDFYAAVRGFEFSASELDKYTWTISQSSKNTSEKFYWIPANKFPGMSND